jgi:protein-S-isoprenylcysteine O-methyltransferase Ste14
MRVTALKTMLFMLLVAGLSVGVLPVRLMGTHPARALFSSILWIPVMMAVSSEMFVNHEELQLTKTFVEVYKQYCRIVPSRIARLI